MVIDTAASTWATALGVCCWTWALSVMIFYGRSEPSPELTPVLTLYVILCLWVSGSILLAGAAMAASIEGIEGTPRHPKPTSSHPWVRIIKNDKWHCRYCGNRLEINNYTDSEGTPQEVVFCTSCEIKKADSVAAMCLEDPERALEMTKTFIHPWGANAVISPEPLIRQTIADKPPVAPPPLEDKGE